MARRPRNEMAVKQFASAITRITKKHPGVTPKDIERWGWLHLEELEVATESIRKALHGQIDPTQCNVELLMLLAAYFRVEPAELGHMAAARLQPVLAYAGITHPNGPGTPSDVASATSRCTERWLRVA